jgi:protoporphyrinogen/coproporphyrinogen III oxidase
MIVIGAGISGLAAAHEAVARGADVIVLEAADHVGGAVRSTVIDGFTFDWGPNGFLANVPDTLALARSVGLGDDLVAASPEASRRYVYWDGALRPLPLTPGAFLRSELVSLPGKLRALTEFVIPHRTRREETVDAFLARHFGYEIARVFGAPLVQGISGGDAREVSVDAMFPRLRSLEASHGSLLRGLLAARRRGGDAGLTSFRSGGMGRLTDALAASLGGRVRTGTRVASLRSRGRPGTLAAIEVHLSDGAVLEDTQVVVAVPADVAAGLLRDEAPAAAEALRGIPSADLHVISFGFDRVDVPHALDGFGFLVPRGGRVRTLGATWNSAVFADQAPAGKVSLRVFAGGVSDPGFTALDDDAALAVARRDLELTMGITAEPHPRHLARWPRGVPQFTLGHVERVRTARERLATTHPGLRLAGNYLDGVGVNDAVRTSAAAVRSLLATPA